MFLCFIVISFLYFIAKVILIFYYIVINRKSDFMSFCILGCLLLNSIIFAR